MGPPWKEGEIRLVVDKTNFVFLTCASDPMREHGHIKVLQPDELFVLS